MVLLTGILLSCQPLSGCQVLPVTTCLLINGISEILMSFSEGLVVMALGARLVCGAIVIIQSHPDLLGPPFWAKDSLVFEVSAVQ